jgi:hypothetical protein
MLKILTRNNIKIFISYRRDDASGHAGRLFSDLVRYFGKSHVFMDIDGIEPGDDFEDVLAQSLRDCHVEIVVIGRQWLLKVDGKSRLDAPEDYVHREISAALARKIHVIPALVQGAVSPRAADLPDDLQPLARRQAIEISDTRWDFDVKRLVRRLEDVLPKPAIAWQRLTIFSVCLILALAGLWWVTKVVLRRQTTNTNIAQTNSAAANSNTLGAGSTPLSSLTPAASPNVSTSPTPAPSSTLQNPLTGLADYDAAHDFSVSGNPRGVWTYGYIDPGVSPNSFTFKVFPFGGTHYDNFSGKTFEGMYAWKLPLPPNTPIGSDIGLLVVKNITNRRVESLAAGQLALHPGTRGYYAVVRWTAPANGSYSLKGQFIGVGGNPTTTDVHISLQGRELLADNINDLQQPHRFSQTVSVKNGDFVDFIVGQGSDKQIWGDLTALDVQITRTRP